MGMSRREFSLLMSSVAAALTAPRLAAAPLRVRREIGSLGPADLDALRAGIGAMRALPTEDFRSWMYQAGIHGASAAESAAIPDAATYWNQCQHGTAHFLTWHRWYLLFCEEIIRTMADQCSFTMPYWDYIADGLLPEPLRVPPDSTNPLYDPTRDEGVNDGTSMMWGLNTSALAKIDFAEFNGHAGTGSIASNPHNTIHNLVMGNMENTKRAGRDPVFWLHHCNIDRYWECWIRQGGGRHHPGSPWRDQTFPFHSLTGRRDVIVADGLRTADLGYTYDNLPCAERVFWELPDWIHDLQLARIAWRRPPIPDPGPWQEVMEISGVTLNGQPTAFSVPRAEFLRVAGVEARRFAVTMHGVEALEGKEKKGFMMELVIVPDAKNVSANNLRDVQLIGSFGRFELSILAAHAEHHGATQTLVLELPESARKALTAAGDEFALMFVRRGLVDREGKPRPFDAKQPLFRIGALRLAVQ